MASASSSSGYREEDLLLPRIPSKPLSHEDFETLSADIIAAYSKIRFTTPYPRTLGIDKVKIQFPTTNREPVETPSKHITDQSQPSEPLAHGLPENPPAPGASEIKKCFLHPKAKPSCPRCKAYIDSRQTPQDIEPLGKKHRVLR